jgi:hypothetical protein
MRYKGLSSFSVIGNVVIASDGAYRISAAQGLRSCLVCATTASLMLVAANAGRLVLSTALAPLRSSNSNRRFSSPEEVVLQVQDAVQVCQTIADLIWDWNSGSWNIWTTWFDPE